MRKNILITMMLSLGAATAANAATTAKSCTELDTNQGKIIVQLNFAKAPVTVANFEQYVSSGFYSNKIFTCWPDVFEGETCANNGGKTDDEEFIIGL